MEFLENEIKKQTKKKKNDDEQGDQPIGRPRKINKQEVGGASKPHMELISLYLFIFLFFVFVFFVHVCEPYIRLLPFLFRQLIFSAMHHGTIDH